MLAYSLVDILVVGALFWYRVSLHLLLFFLISSMFGSSFSLFFNYFLLSSSIPEVSLKIAVLNFDANSHAESAFSERAAWG